MNIVSLAIFAATVLLSPCIATAQDLSKVELNLQGSIEPRCEIDNMTPFVDFSSSDVGAVNFEIYCNLEMSIGISARNGALVNEDAVASNGPDAAYSRDYSVTLSLEAFGFSRQVQGESLITGVSFDVTDGVVYQTNGSLIIEMQQPVAGGYAGKYVDEIRISVSPSLSSTAPS